MVKYRGGLQQGFRTFLPRGSYTFLVRMKFIPLSGLLKTRYNQTGMYVIVYDVVMNSEKN